MWLHERLAKQGRRAVSTGTRQADLTERLRSSKLHSLSTPVRMHPLTLAAERHNDDESTEPAARKKRRLRGVYRGINKRGRFNHLLPAAGFSCGSGGSKRECCFRRAPAMVAGPLGSHACNRLCPTLSRTEMRAAECSCRRLTVGSRSDFSGYASFPAAARQLACGPSPVVKDLNFNEKSTANTGYHRCRCWGPSLLVCLAASTIALRAAAARIAYRRELVRVPQGI